MVKNLSLKRVLKGIEEREVLIPKMHIALNNPNFKGFQIDIEPWESRPFDGYFHPSTQGTWNPRQLSLYLNRPDLFETELMELTSVFAITQGHFWHMFIQTVLEEDGILVDSEVAFVDEVYKRKGHMDGLLKIGDRFEGLEIKTMNQYTIKKVTSAETLKEFKYEYWAQAQEYLDVFDLPVMRFLIINPTYPFPMVEFTVPADNDHQEERQENYLKALNEELGNLSCCGKPTSCPAQYACRFKGV